MLKDFLNRLLELNREEQIVDSFHREYMLKGTYEKVNDPLVPTFNTKTLSSIVAYIKENFDKQEDLQFVINVLSHNEVTLTSSVVGRDLEREVYVRASAENPSFSFGRFHDQENFVVSLLSKFKESAGREYALGVASNIVEDEEIKMIDNGLAQTAMMKKGIAAVENEKVTPYVKMIPYRTFIEIEQPASIFLLRLRRGGELALFEADGGAWKQDAIKNIVEYFIKELEDIDNVSILA